MAERIRFRITSQNGRLACDDVAEWRELDSNVALLVAELRRHDGFVIELDEAVRRRIEEKFPASESSAESKAFSEPRAVPCTDHEIDRFEDRGRARGLERAVEIDWVACSSEGFPGEEITSAPTRAGLVDKLVEKHEGDREYVDSMLMNGDVFTRRRITVRAWAHEETAEPSLDWVSNQPECLCELARREASR